MSHRRGKKKINANKTRKKPFTFLTTTTASKWRTEKIVNRWRRPRNGRSTAAGWKENGRARASEWEREKMWGREKERKLYARSTRVGRSCDRDRLRRRRLRHSTAPPPIGTFYVKRTARRRCGAPAVINRRFVSPTTTILSIDRGDPMSFYYSLYRYIASPCNVSQCPRDRLS